MNKVSLQTSFEINFSNFSYIFILNVNTIKIHICLGTISLRLDTDYKWKLFHYSTYFGYHSWALLHFLILFMGLTVFFQLSFTFIYNTFSNKLTRLLKPPSLTTCRHLPFERRFQQLDQRLSNGVFCKIFYQILEIKRFIIFYKTF